MTNGRVIRREWLYALCLVPLSLFAAPPETQPVEGLRENPPAVHALVDARIVVSADRTVDKGTIVIRDGVIITAGSDVQPPPGARIWNLQGKTVYPGLIDAFGEVSATAPEGGAPYWNSQVVPQLQLADLYQPNRESNKKFREQGFVCRLLAPSAGVIKGTSVLVATGDEPVRRAIWRPQVALHLRLGVSRGRGGGYPNSPMGAVALARQALLDARWYGAAWAAYQANPSLPKPEQNAALEALRPYLDGERTVVIDGANELYFLRADAFSREFSLNAVIRGSGQEYQRLDAIRDCGRAVIVPVNFPKPPRVQSPEDQRDAELGELLHWDMAPENPARLAAAGVRIAFTSSGLTDEKEFLGAIRTAVKRGLPASSALRALTSDAAEILGVAERLGTIEPGKSASLVVTDGDLFVPKTKVLATWINGAHYEVAPTAVPDVRGEWQLTVTESDGAVQSLIAQVSGEPEKLQGKIVLPLPENAKPEDKPTEVKLEKLALHEGQLSGTLDGKDLNQPGVIQFSATLLASPAENWSLSGAIAWPTGNRATLKATRTSTSLAAPEPEAASKEREEKPPDSEQQSAEDEKKEIDLKASFPVTYPLNAFGRAAPPEQPVHVLFQNATIWTCGPQGTLTDASLLVSRGRIVAVGPDIAVPEGTVIIDAAGKHLSPGIIDCHSHMATDGGVNEGTQAITAEVRIGDFIDCNDVDIYRQLAGGVTAANVLHGSANPIGGQNQVIKLRWGALFDDMRFAEAPAGIKFALGENVKRSNFEREGPVRYPTSRMGVEQIIRDAFQAAREYQAQWRRWEQRHDTLPPRRDLELEALVEILEGKRWVHCHSYRQDEILALLRTCEEFGIRIATLQHILEGYKVADAMARHGAMGSAFSDWWAYKIEVYDAIPYNGALMHHAGVVVSFNSDDRELARHLNHEAAKGMKYGNVPAEEALKFVTLNPARQLRIDTWTGSLESGKHADFVVWNAPPLSLAARCEQTWIDGRKYFDREEDRELLKTVRSRHATLVQKVLASGQSSRKPEEDQKPDEELWPRFDEFCRAKGLR